MSEERAEPAGNNYDVVDQEFRFSYRGKEYVLREPTDDANTKHHRKLYQNAKVKGTEVQADINDAIEAPSVLLGECVFNGDGKPVGPKVIREWSRRLVSRLYDKARAMAGNEESAESIDAQINRLQELKEGLPDPKKPASSTATD